MRSSPVTTAMLRSILAFEQTAFKAAAHASGLTPPALLITFIPTKKALMTLNHFIYILVQYSLKCWCYIR